MLIIMLILLYIVTHINKLKNFERTKPFSTVILNNDIELQFHKNFDNNSYV